MAKRESKLARFGDAISEWLGDRLAAVDGVTRAWLLRSAVLTLLIAGLVGVSAWGLRRLERTVHARENFQQPLTLEWVDLPEWLRMPENGHVLDSLVARVNLHETDHMLDPDLASRLGAALTAPDVGWVKALDRIDVRPDGVVAIKCSFREPRAWVKQGSSCYLVDSENVRLPGRYDAVDCQGSALMTIIGVRGKPPAVGQHWTTPDLASGARLVSLLSTRSFHEDIAAINVSNHDGRVDRSRPNIELVTAAKGSRIWWGLPPDQEHGKEISAAQKVTLLETLYRQCGRLSVNRPYIDIRTWPDRIAMPMAIPSSTQPRVLRG